MNVMRRVIHPEVRVEDSKRGIVTYVASDESIDSYGEIIIASGWRFTRFAKNSPFVDSHNYSSVAAILGHVIDFSVKGRRLVETVQWAIDAEAHDLARIGWQLTLGGHLRAVSVGFHPVRTLKRGDEDWNRTLRDLGIPASEAPRTIYAEQEQVELSAVVIGANPNALAQAKAAGVITESDLSIIQRHAGSAPSRISADRRRFLDRVTAISTRTSTLHPSPSMTTIFAPQSNSSDADTRRALDRLTLQKEAKAPESDLRSSMGEILRANARDQVRTREAIVRKILGDDFTCLAINACIRRLVDAPLGDDHKAFFRAIGEDTGAGAAYISEAIGQDLYDVLALSGAWNTLGVRPVRSKQGKFPVTSAVPDAQFILAEGVGWTADTTFSGTSVQAETEVVGVLLNVSIGLYEDLEADLAPDFLEKFERAVNARLDHACFVGDGTEDGDNGGMTGLFEAAGIPEVVAANGNTSVQTLDHEDFLKVLDAAPAGVLQRQSAWWINPSLLIKAMRVQDGSGKSIVRTAIEDGGATAFSIAGYPVHLVAAAPSANEASAKVAVFGEPGGYLVGIRKNFSLEHSGHAKWNTAQRSYRALSRARGILREDDAFVMLTLAAS